MVSPFAAWESFYVIVGSSAAALTGLMFVVVTLIAETRPQGQTLDAFGTPTVVHLTGALLVAATMSAPWPTPEGARLVLGATGVAGVIYALIVVRRTRRQTQYRPVLEDWIWHSVIPLMAYLVLAAAALVLDARPVPALFAVGAATLLLVVVGIHNAWDTVTYVTLERMPPAKAEAPERAAP
jgi:hypothetical protein